MVGDQWTTRTVGEVATLQRGFDLPSRLRQHGSVPVITSSGRGYFHNFAMVRGPGVVTGRYGTIGEVYVVEEDFWPLNTTLYVSDFHGNDTRFVAYLLKTIDFKTHSGKSGVPGVNRNDIHELEVAVPERRAEQEAIAEALSDADALIESLEQLIAKKRLIKQGVMQELLTGKRRLPGFEGEWKTKKVGQLGYFLKGRGVSKAEANSGALPCVRYGEIYTHHQDHIRQFYSGISHRVAANATRLVKGDLLFAGSGETKAEIGKCVAFVDDIEAYAGGDIVILRPSDGDSAFLGYSLNSAEVVSQKARRGQGDAVVHISARALADVEVRFPDVVEQAAIARVLKDIDLEIAEIDARIEKARLLKQGMMQQLLTGRIRLA